MKYTILATVVALCTTEAKFLRHVREHRLLHPECDPTPNPSVQGQPIDIVFAIDLSESMCKKKDLAGETWLRQTKDAVTTFINKISTHSPSTSMIGMSGAAYVKNGEQVFNLLTRDLQAASNFVVTGLGCHGYWDVKKGYSLKKALELFDASTRPDTETSTKAIILITDQKAGSATCNPQGMGSDVFKERGITIYTVGYGTDAEEGDVALSVIANCGVSGGFFRRSTGASANERIFDEIFRDITN